MPSMASMTVKKADGTTDVTFDQMMAAAGDNSPAVWRQDIGQPVGLPVGFRPSFSLTTKWNGPKTARQCALSAAFPYAVQDSTTSLYSAKDRVVFNGVFLVPQVMPWWQINEAVRQISHLVGHELVKSSAVAGFAPV